MEEDTTNKAEIPVDGCGSTTGIGPGFGSVFGKRGVRMLEVGYRNFSVNSVSKSSPYYNVSSEPLGCGEYTEPVIHP